MRCNKKAVRPVGCVAFSFSCDLKNCEPKAIKQPGTPTACSNVFCKKFQSSSNSKPRHSPSSAGSPPGSAFSWKPTAAPGPGSFCSSTLRTPYPAASKRKGGAKTAASTPLPRATMRGPILIPILQVPPGTCWLSAKSAARGCPSRRRWMIPSADSTCLTGWTRALCRRHGWRAAKRFSLSYAIDAFGSPPQSRIVL